MHKRERGGTARHGGQATSRRLWDGRVYADSPLATTNLVTRIGDGHVQHEDGTAIVFKVSRRSVRLRSPTS
jgi:hypothetical protein